MKVVFRADASIKIGTGHVMRCLTLAEELRERGAEVCFACVALPGNLIQYVREQGYDCHVLIKTDDLILAQGDWLVVDHYQLDFEWENLMRVHFHKIFVIDDLANRKHDCDVLLDQNYFSNQEKRYQNLISEACHMFCGPRHTLLRKEFWNERQGFSRKNDIVEKILVSFGGTDPSGETLRFLRWWKSVSIEYAQIALLVVVGQNCLDKEKILDLAQTMKNISIHIQTKQMAKLICEADIGVGSGGSSIWERCYLELPTVVRIVADNQREVSNEAAALGVVLQGTEEQFFELVKGLIADKQKRSLMIDKMRAVFWGMDKPSAAWLVDYMEGEV